MKSIFKTPGGVCMYKH